MAVRLPSPSPGSASFSAPQDYRDWQNAPYYRRLYYSYKYFFAVSQPSRNEHDGAIFAGTMGLIRRVALEQLGGWDEWCITEDAELSLRLLRAGWHGLHMDQTWGRGIMPLTFEGLKGQRYRWCFGGIQILRMHWRSLLPGRKARDNHLGNAQRWAYLAGGVQWYGDLLGLVFFVFLLAGACEPGDRGRRVVPQAHPVPGRYRAGPGRPGPDPRDSAAAPGHRSVLARRARRVLHLAVNVAGGQPGLRAGPVRPQGGLPAYSEDQRAGKWWEALRANWAETTLALLGLAGIAGALTKATQLSGPLLAVLLLFPTLGMAAAPVNSWAAQRAALPSWLRERRRTEYRRDRSAIAAGAATGGLVAVLGVVAAVMFLLLAPTHHLVQPPSLLGPAQGSHTSSPATSPSSSPARSSAPATPTTSTSSASATPSAVPSPTVSVTPSVTASASATTPTGTATPTP